MSRDIYRTAAGRLAIAGWCRDRLDGWATAHETVVVPTPVGATQVLIAGSGAPVVLIPGTNFATAVWLELVAALAVQRRVVALDIPGQPGLSAPLRPGRPVRGDGWSPLTARAWSPLTARAWSPLTARAWSPLTARAWSPLTARAWSPLTARAWLDTVVREADAAGAVVIGHSLGAAIALAGAAHGAQVAALALFNPAGLTRLRVTAPVLTRTARWLLRPSPETARGLLEVMTTALVPDHMTAWMALVGRHVRTSLAPPPLPEAALHRVGVPVHLYAGARDVFLPAAALLRTADRLPSARLTIVEHAGHLLPIERPDLVAAAVVHA